MYSYSTDRYLHTSHAIFLAYRFCYSEWFNNYILLFSIMKEDERPEDGISRKCRNVDNRGSKSNAEQPGKLNYRR